MSLTASTETDKAQNQRVVDDLLDCFRMYAAKGIKNPLVAIAFVSEGGIISPPDFSFLGYGQSAKGMEFEASGGFVLDDLFPYEEATQKLLFTFDDAWPKACQLVSDCLRQVASSAEFQSIPRDGAVVFVLQVVDQVKRTIGRIHPDGTYEVPPKAPHA